MIISIEMNMIFSYEYSPPWFVSLEFRRYPNRVLLFAEPGMIEQQGNIFVLLFLLLSSFFFCTLSDQHIQTKWDSFIRSFSHFLCVSLYSTGYVETQSIIHRSLAYIHVHSVNHHRGNHEHFCSGYDGCTSSSSCVCRTVSVSPFPFVQYISVDYLKNFL